MLVSHRMPFLANQVMSYFHVFILLLTFAWLLHNSLAPRLSVSACQTPSSHVGSIALQVNSRQNGKFHGHRVESLLGSPTHAAAIVMPFSAHSATINLNVGRMLLCNYQSLPHIH